MFQKKNLRNSLNFDKVLGKGAFGIVYSGTYLKNNVNIKSAMKCELRKDNIDFDNSMICKEYLLFTKMEEVKNRIVFNNMNDDKTIMKIFNYIRKNDMLSIPNELMPTEYMKKNIIIPRPYKLIKTEDYFLFLMDLCGEDFEKITTKYDLTERCKYYVAEQLLQVMCCVHSCGIIHRDLKLANIVLSKKIGSISNREMKIMLIDFGLAKEYYVYDTNRVMLQKPKKLSSVIGTIRYISLNVHEFKSPTIIDDLISICYILINIFIDKPLPWSKHIKTDEKFEIKKHTKQNCPCGYHKNKINGDTMNHNTVAEVKYHIDLDELCGEYVFIKLWLKYLFSLNEKQMPDYGILYRILMENIPFEKSELYFEINEKLSPSSSS